MMRKLQLLAERREEERALVAAAGSEAAELLEGLERIYTQLRAEAARQEVRRPWRLFWRPF
jgi:hypothetical protein